VVTDQENGLQPGKNPCRRFPGGSRAAAFGAVMLEPALPCRAFTGAHLRSAALDGETEKSKRDRMLFFS